MPDSSSSFPETRRDVGNLKTTAVEAAKDLASTATTHANKAKDQVRDLAGHAQSEAGDQFNAVSGQMNDLVGSARDYVVARPLTCLGIALAFGFIFGLSRRSSS